MDSLNVLLPSTGKATETLIQNAWNISPASIFGFVLCLMLIIIVAQSIVIYKLYTKQSDASDKFTTLLEGNIKVIAGFTEQFSPDKQKLVHENLVGQMREAVRTEAKEFLHDMEAMRNTKSHAS